MGPGYSVVLVLHVLASVVGFGALVMTGMFAHRARSGPGSAAASSVRRYFRPGVNWVARVVYAVPLLGLALVAMSHGSFDFGDPFVFIGLVLWGIAAAAAEVVVWPGERGVQRMVAGNWPRHDTGGQFRRQAEWIASDRLCRRVSAAAYGVAGVFVAAAVVMVVKP
jgi:uncharacterized membrane protein